MENNFNILAKGGMVPSYRSAFAPVRGNQENVAVKPITTTLAEIPVSVPPSPEEKTSSTFPEVVKVPTPIFNLPGKESPKIAKSASETLSYRTSEALTNRVPTPTSNAFDTSPALLVSNDEECDVLQGICSTDYADRAENTVFPYDTGIIEDSDDEDDGDIIEVLSCYALDQCSRTSPSNHATIRRWKQRSIRGVKVDAQNINYSTGDLRVSKPSCGASKHSQMHERPLSSVGGLLSQPVTVNTNVGSPLTSLSAGPSSAPSTFHWDSPGVSSVGRSFSPSYPKSTRVDSPMQPQASSTPIQNAAVRKSSKFPFNISSIVTKAHEIPAAQILDEEIAVEHTKTKICQQKEQMFVEKGKEVTSFSPKYNENNMLHPLDKIPKNISKGAHSIPVGIAVARQRENPRLPAGAKVPQHQEKTSISPSSFISPTSLPNLPSHTSLSSISASSAINMDQRNYFATPTSYGGTSMPSSLPSLCQPEVVRPGFPGSHYPYLGSSSMPWTSYPPAYLTPDYLLLQQQLLLLHQLQKAQQGPTPQSPLALNPEYSVPLHYLSAAYGPVSQSSIIPPFPDLGLFPWSSNVDLGQSQVDKSNQSHRQTSDYSSNTSSFINSSDPSQGNISQEDSFNLSLNTEDSGLEVSTESNNNVTKENKLVGEKSSSPDTERGELCVADGVASSQGDSDSISVGSESEYGTATSKYHDETDTVIENKEDKINDIEISAENEISSIKENNSEDTGDNINKGLYLLTEGIDCMERRGTMRHLSVDSYHHKKYDNLQILCDVANQQQAEKVDDMMSRSSRSKSLDAVQEARHSSGDCSPDPVSRNHRSPRAEQTIKEFISRKSTTYQRYVSTNEDSSNVFGDMFKIPSNTQDLEEMDAWEIDIRIKMAEKQRKYNAITKKLKRLSSVKSKKEPKQEKCCKKEESTVSEDDKVLNVPIIEKGTFQLQECVSTLLEHTVSSNIDHREKEDCVKDLSDKSVKSKVMKIDSSKCMEEDTGIKEKPNTSTESSNPVIGKLSNFADTFNKFKKAYFKNKKSEDFVISPSSQTKENPEHNNIIKNYTDISVPAENWPKNTRIQESVVDCQNANFSAFEGKIKQEILDDASSAAPENHLNIPKSDSFGGKHIKLEIIHEHEKEPVQSTYSPVLKERILSEFTQRKRPKLEKYVVSDVLKSPEHKYPEERSKANKRYSGECDINKKKIRKDKKDKEIEKDKRNVCYNGTEENCDKVNPPTLMTSHKDYGSKKIKEEPYCDYIPKKMRKENFPSQTEDDHLNLSNSQELHKYIKKENNTNSPQYQCTFDEEAEYRRQRKERKKKEKERKEYDSFIRNDDGLHYDLKKKKRKKDKKNRKEKERIKEKESDWENKWIKDDNENLTSNGSGETVKEKVLKPSKPQSRACTLTSEDLRDGLRILKKIGSHFYPGRITEISPPDIYGIVVDRERGNKPHIFSQEEVLDEAILEMRPKTVPELAPGDRVCAYWSSKIHYLHPGTVAGPDTVDPNYIIIELDDGDSRDIHIDSIRYLPPAYPIVDQESDPITYLSGCRRRNTAASSSTPSTSVQSCSTTSTPVKACTVPDTDVQTASTTSTPVKKSSKTSSKRSSKDKAGKSKRIKNEEFWSVVSVTEVSEDNTTTAVASNMELSQLPGPDNPTPEWDDDQDSAFVSNGPGGEDSDFEEGDSSTCHQRRISGTDKSAIRAFLPPQHLLWAWADQGKKLTNKARKLFHQTVSREGESLGVGDCAVFLSTGRPDRPYIGRIQSMWESWTGNMKVQVKWFYHAAETEGTAKGGGRVEDIKTLGALFESSHFDENDIQTISHKCEVLGFSEFISRRTELDCEESEDIYYLAGEYDPVEGSIIFKPDIFLQ